MLPDVLDTGSHVALHLGVAVHEQAFAEAEPTVAPAQVVHQKEAGELVLVLAPRDLGVAVLVGGVEPTPIPQLFGAWDDDASDRVLWIVPIDQTEIVGVRPERVARGYDLERGALLRGYVDYLGQPGHVRGLLRGDLGHVHLRCGPPSVTERHARLSGAVGPRVREHRCRQSRRSLLRQGHRPDHMTG